MGKIGRKRSAFWLCLAAALIALSFVAAWLFRTDGRVAVISQDGKELYRIELDDVDEGYEIEIGGRYENTVEIEHGRVRVSHATCPDRICVDMGWKSEGGSPIVCLPNRLVIEIEGGGDDIDAAAK